MKVTRQMRFLITSLGLFCLILGTEQHRSRSSGGPLETPTVTETLYKFTSRLFSTLNNGSKSEPDNIIVSPISIHKALNLVLLGTDARTETEREFHRVLGYASEHDAQKCHKEYARVLAKFKQLTQKALVAAKEEQGEVKTRQPWEKSEPRAPVLDLFNMVITKNKAEVLPEYRRKIEMHYNSTVDNVDDRRPETKRKIMDKLNKWAKEAGFDSEIMKQKELDGDFEVILLSAIHVQVSWLFGHFYESKGKAIFYKHGLKDKPVDGLELKWNDAAGVRYLELTDVARAHFKERAERFMRDSPDTFKLLSKLNAQVVSVPLSGGLTYTIFEPLEHSTPDDNKLNRLVEQLFGKRHLPSVLELLDGINGWASHVDLTMPKFKFERELELGDVLKSMGIKRAFKVGSSEISSLTGSKGLAISMVIHQAVIDVTKNGVKAAAVTKITTHIKATRNQKPRAPFPVSITKPFVFLIRYEKMPLFVGQLSSL